MPVNLKGRSFLTLRDYAPQEIRYLLDLSHDLKRKKRAGIPGDLLRGPNRNHRGGADEPHPGVGAVVYRVLGDQIDHPGHALLLKGEQAALKMLTVVQRLAEKDHISLLFQLLDDACHYLNGKAVAEITQDQADKVGGVGAKIGGGYVMHVAQGGDGGVDFFDRRL